MKRELVCYSDARNINEKSDSDGYVHKVFGTCLTSFNCDRCAVYVSKGSYSCCVSSGNGPDPRVSLSWEYEFLDVDSWREAGV